MLTKENTVKCIGAFLMFGNPTNLQILIKRYWDFGRVLNIDKAWEDFKAHCSYCMGNIDTYLIIFGNIVSYCVIFIHIYVITAILTYSMQISESWITKCGSRLIYKLLPGKEILYVILITSILGKLLTVRARDTGTIPYRYSGTKGFKRKVARANSAPGSGPIYFVSSWVLAQLLAREVLGWLCDM